MSKQLENKVEEAVEEVIAGLTEGFAEGVAEQFKKPYTLRELEDEDLYTVLEIVGKVLPDDAKEAFAQAVSGGKVSLEEVGGKIAFDLIKYILKNFKSVKNEVYAFLSDLSGLSADEIRKMPFGTTPAMLKEVFMNEKNSDFFKGFSKLFS